MKLDINGASRNEIKLYWFPTKIHSYIVVVNLKVGPN